MIFLKFLRYFQIYIIWKIIAEVIGVVGPNKTRSKQVGFNHHIRVMLWNPHRPLDFGHISHLTLSTVLITCKTSPWIWCVTTLTLVAISSIYVFVGGSHFSRPIVNLEKKLQCGSHYFWEDSICNGYTRFQLQVYKLKMKWSYLSNLIFCLIFDKLAWSYNV